MMGFSKFFRGKRQDEYLDVSKQDILKRDKIRKKFHDITSKNVSTSQIDPIRKYLSSSELFDAYYKGTNKAFAKDARAIEELIKKTKTPQNLILYRGFQSEDNIGVGTVITHHSITSYGGSKAFADMYHDRTSTNHLIVLKVPKGTHAAYIEHIAQEKHFKFSKKDLKAMFSHGGEENWILHPGAKIKIVKSKHDKIKDRFVHDAILVSDGVN